MFSSPRFLSCSDDKENSSSQELSLGANSERERPMSERKVETLGTKGVGAGISGAGRELGA